MPQRWNSTEDAVLQRVLLHGGDFKEVAANLDRTVRSCQDRWKKIKSELSNVVQSRRADKCGLFYCDVHYPHQDNVALKMMWSIIQSKLKLDFIVDGGDVWDCPELSKFRKNTLSESQLLESKEQVIQHFVDMREMFPEADIYMLEGNHDVRWTNYIIDKAPYLVEFPEMQLRHILKLDESNVKLVEYTALSGSRIHFDKIMFGHWNKALQASGSNAKWLVNRYQRSLIHAHIHRLGSYFKTPVGTELVGYEGGCLCKLDPEYISDPDWQQGFSIISFTDDGYFGVTQVPIIHRDGVVFAFYDGDYFECPDIGEEN